MYFLNDSRIMLCGKRMNSEVFILGPNFEAVGIVYITLIVLLEADRELRRENSDALSIC